MKEREGGRGRVRKRGEAQVEQKVVDCAVKLPRALRINESHSLGLHGIMRGMPVGSYLSPNIILSPACIVRIIDKKIPCSYESSPHVFESNTVAMVRLCYYFNIHERAVIEELFSVFIFKALLE